MRSRAAASSMASGRPASSEQILATAAALNRLPARRQHAQLDRVGFGSGRSNRPAIRKPSIADEREKSSGLHAAPKLGLFPRPGEGHRAGHEGTLGERGL